MLLTKSKYLYGLQCLQLLWTAVNNKDKIPLPDKIAQKKFAKVVESVEKLKENVKKTNKNSKELFDSLMNKAFKGELVR